MVSVDVFGKSRYSLIDYESEIEIKVIRLKILRDVLIINDTITVSASCKLIMNNSNQIISERNSPLWRSSNYQYTPSLGDLSDPYKLIKKSHNDTLVVIKDNDTILFNRKDY